MNFDQYCLQFLTEDSIENIGFDGDWSDNAKPRGWDKPSIGILKNEKGIERLKTKWNKTSYPFDMWFVRSPKGYKYTEIGEVSFEFVRDKLGMDISINEDHITIIYTNNKGAERVPATPWTLAHRLGHAIRMRNPMYQDLNRHVNNLINEIASKIYGRNTNTNNSYGNYGNNNQYSENEKIKLQVAHALGTFKSARDKNLRNVGEFTNELVAQYIITDNIVFNKEFPSLLATKYAWGKAQGPNKKQQSDEMIDDLHNFIDNAEDTIHYLIDDLIGNSIGKIYVM